MNKTHEGQPPKTIEMADLEKINPVLADQVRTALAQGTSTTGEKISTAVGVDTVQGPEAAIESEFANLKKKVVGCIGDNMVLSALHHNIAASEPKSPYYEGPGAKDEDLDNRDSLQGELDSAEAEILTKLQALEIKAGSDSVIAAKAARLIHLIQTKEVYRITGRTLSVGADLDELFEQY